MEPNFTSINLCPDGNDNLASATEPFDELVEKTSSRGEYFCNIFLNEQ